MAGLDDLSSANPPGTETPTSGDDRIRALTAKLIYFANIAHHLAGEHKFARGPLASRPAAGHSGDFYILEVSGLLAALQYDTGTAWVTLTSLNEIGDVISDLATHIAANPIDHPDASVTATKILQGAILKKHLEGGGSTDTASIAALVNAGSADALHHHDQYVVTADLSPIANIKTGIGPWRWKGTVGGYKSLYQNWLELSPSSDPPLSPTYADWIVRSAAAGSGLWLVGNPIAFEVISITEAPVNLRVTLFSLFALNQTTWTIKAGIGSTPTLSSFSSTATLSALATVASQDMGVISISTAGTYYFGIQASAAGPGGEGEIFINKALLTLESP
jgi:hypothetical protein